MDDYLASCIAKESAAVRKDVQSGQASHVASRGSDRLIGTPAAGTQALPVDTTPKRLGRPRKHPDRKAYRAEWLRKDRRDHPEKYGKAAKGKSE